jgi:hypothetical protein
MDSIETHLQKLSRQMVRDPKAVIPVAEVIDMLLDAQNYADSLAIPFDGDGLTKILNSLKKI